MKYCASVNRSGNGRASSFSIRAVLQPRRPPESQKMPEVLPLHNIQYLIYDQLPSDSRRKGCANGQSPPARGEGGNNMRKLISRLALFAGAGAAAVAGGFFLG